MKEKLVIKNKLHRKKKGFTVIELVAVIVLMSILALIFIPNLTAYTNKADDAKILANMKTIHTSAELVKQTDGKIDKAKISKLSNNENVSIDIVEDLDRVYDVYYVEQQKSNIIVKHLDRNDKLHVYPEDLANYTISFNTDGGNSIPSITQIYGSKITKPKDPIKLGHVFGGWSPLIPETMPLYSVVIKAAWDIQKLTIEFDPDGGIVSPESITTNYGEKVELPTPTRLFYLFEGWYTEKEGKGTKVNSIESLETNRVLYAKWKLDNIITRVKPTGTTSNTQTHKIPLDGVKTINSVKVISPNGGTATVKSIGNNEITIEVTGASKHDRTIQTGGVLTPADSKNVKDTKTSYGSNTNPNSIEYNSGGYTGTLIKDNTTTDIYQTGGSYTPADSKTVYDSETYYGSSNGTSSSIYYNSGGYSGYLYKNGSVNSYLYSGEAGGSRQETTTDYTNRIWQWEWDGSKWVYIGVSHDPSKPYEPSSSVYYSNNGYSGYLYERTSERNMYSLTTNPRPTNPYKGQTYVDKRQLTRYYYYGTVTKPDTRVWRYSQDYAGTVTRPGSDTRTYSTSYTGHYSGIVNKPESDTRTYDKFYDYELEIDYSKN